MAKAKTAKPKASPKAEPARRPRRHKAAKPAPVIEGADAVQEAEPGEVEITNEREGSIIILPDGRRLHFGESAVIDRETEAHVRAGGWL